MHGLGLGLHGPGERVVERPGVARGQRLLHHHVNHRPVLRVHAHQRAQLGCPLHQLEDRRVVHHQHIGIRHEDLEAGDSFGDHRVHIVQPRIVRAQVCDRHMQGVVDAGLALGLGAPCLEGLGHRMAHGLQDEVDHRCCPANGGSARSPLVIVRAHRSAEGHVQMRVHIDAAGQHQHSRRINYRVSRRVDLQRNPRNRLAPTVHRPAMLPPHLPPCRP